MITPISTPGETVDVQPHGTALDARQKSLLVKTDDVEIFRFVIPAREKIPTYEAQGEIILHCLEGRVSLTALAETHPLKAGQLLCLLLNEPFSIQGIEDALLLVTIIAPKHGSNVQLIGDGNGA